jgi:hypothetical protein
VVWDRREVSSSRGVKHGDVITVDLATPAGRQVLRVRADARTDVTRLIQALRR